MLKKIEYIEIIFMLTLGIVLQVTDGSPFTMKSKWNTVWETELPAAQFGTFVQKCIILVLLVIVTVRCMTTYVYVVSAVLVLFSILTNSNPKLMRPWLLISMFKSICMTFIEALTGVYVCSAFGKIRKACIEFFISKALEIILASYLWGSIQNRYSDMERKAAEKPKPLTLEQLFAQRQDFGRYRTRSLVDESIMYKTARLNDFDYQDVPRIILQMLRKEQDLSQDSLIASRMMLSSISNLGSYDHLKTSQSLGELGIVDLKNCDVIGLDEEDTMSPIDRALKFLKLTWTDVKKAKQNRKKIVDVDLYNVDESVWNKLLQTKPKARAPKHENKQVFLREIYQTQSSNNYSNAKSNREVKFIDRINISVFNFGHNKSEGFDLDEDSMDASLESERDDFFESNMFMSNLRGEKGMTLSIMTKAMKGGAYERLYKQDFMSVIGSEVFDTSLKIPKFNLSFRDNESKLVKSTPSLRMSKKRERRMSNTERIEQPIPKKQEPEPPEALEQPELETNAELPNSHLSIFSQESEKSSITSKFLEKAAVPEKKGLVKETGESRPQEITIRRNSLITIFDYLVKKFMEIWKSIQNSTQEVRESQKPQKYFKKRRIVIKINGNKLERKKSEEGNVGGEKPDDGLQPKLNLLPDIRSYFEDSKPLSNKVPSKSTKFESNNSVFEKSQKSLYHTEIPTALKVYFEFKKKNTRYNSLSRKRSSGFRNLLREDNNVRDYKKILMSIQNEGKKNWKSKVMAAAALSVAFGGEMHRSLSSMSFISGKSKFDFKKEFKNRQMDLLKKRVKYLVENEVSDIESESGSESDGGDSSPLQTASGESMESCKKSFASFGNNSKIYYSTTSTNTTYSEIEDKSSKNSSFKDSSQYPSVEGIRKKDSSLEENVVWSEASSHEMVYSTTDFFEKDGKTESNTTPGPSKEPRPRNSEESFSLYYSKAADLSSPLLDMKRFIYPDRIHYSYKHVKKKGFDVHLSGGLPLLVRESLNTHPNNEIQTVRNNGNPKSKITRRPMDLSFANTHKFAEWQSNDRSETILNTTEISEEEKEANDTERPKKEKVKKKGQKVLKEESSSQCTIDNKPHHLLMKGVRQLYSVKDYLLMEKLLKIYKRKFSKEEKPKPTEKEKTPVQISSTQLHSNKGRVHPLYNPALFLQENKTRFERKKMESHVERTKDMFARLEGEILMQNRNFKRPKRS